MKQTRRRRRRTAVEIVRLVAAYEGGNQSRSEFCAAHGLAVTTLDSYRRRYRPAENGLLEIDLHGAVAPAGESSGVAVVLRNGRRVEIEWSALTRVPDHRQPLRALLALLEEA